MDMANVVSGLLGEKDGEEMVSPSVLRHRLSSPPQRQMILSSRLTSTAMIHYFKPKMESVVDRGTKVPHSTFTACVPSSCV